MGGERHFVLEERQMAFHLLACFKAIPPNAEGQTKKIAWSATDRLSACKGMARGLWVVEIASGRNRPNRSQYLRDSKAATDTRMLGNDGPK